MKINWRKIFVRLGIGLSILFLLLLALVWYLQPIATKYLNDNVNKILNKNPENLLAYKLGEIKIDIWKGDLSIDRIEIQPKDSTIALFEKGERKSLITIESHEVSIQDLELWELYQTGAISLNRIKLESTTINLRVNPSIKDTVETVPLSEMIADLKRELIIGEIRVNNVSLTYNKDFLNPKNTVKIDSLDLVVQKLYASPETALKDFPFDVEDVFVESKNIAYQIDSLSNFYTEDLHFSLIKESLKCKNVKMKSGNLHDLTLDSIVFNGIDLMNLMESNNLLIEEVNIFKPVIYINENKSKKENKQLDFRSFFPLPVVIQSINVFKADVILWEHKKGAFNEKIKFANIDLQLEGISNVKTDSIQRKRLEINKLKLRCSPSVLFKNSRFGETKKMSIDEMELDVDGLYTDSTIFYSDAMLTSQYFKLDFKRIEYDVSNKTHIEVLEFDLDNVNQILHLGHVKIRNVGKEPKDNKLYSEIEKMDIHGVNVKSMLRNGLIDLDSINIDGIYVGLEQWEKAATLKKENNKIDFKAYIGIPLHVEIIALKNAGFSLKTRLINGQDEEIKIEDINIKIDKFSNDRKSGNSIGKEIGFNKLALECHPRIMMMDSLGKIDRVLLMDDLKLDFSQVYTNAQLINTSVPLRIDDYNLDFGGLVFNLDDFYTLKVGDIRFNKKKQNLIFDLVSIHSKHNKKEHVEKFGHQTEWMDVRINSVDVLGLNIKEILMKKKFFIDRVIANNVDLKLFRDKNYERPPFKEKDLPVKKILKIKTPFNISAIDLKNVSLFYEEVPEGKVEPGSVSFQKLNCKIANVTNVKELIDNNHQMTLDLWGVFMEDIALTAKYTFDLSGPNKPFTLEGKVENFEMNLLDDTVDKLIGIGIKSGTVSWVKFWFEADNEKSSGWFDMYYKDFKVEAEVENDIRILGIRANWFLNGAANAIVIPQNTNVRKFRRGIIVTERMKDRSVFNYSWHSLKTGMMSSVGLKKSIKIELE